MQDTLGTRPACLKAARAALFAGRSVCVDNTNVDPTARAEWVALAKEAGVSIRVLLLGSNDSLSSVRDHLQSLRIISPLGEHPYCLICLLELQMCAQHIMTTTPLFAVDRRAWWTN